MIWKCQIGTNLKTEKQLTAKSSGLEKMTASAKFGRQRETG